MSKEDMIETAPKTIIFRPGEGVHWNFAVNDNRLPRNVKLKRIFIAGMVILALLAGLWFS